MRRLARRSRLGISLAAVVLCVACAPPSRPAALSPTPGTDCVVLERSDGTSDKLCQESNGLSRHFQTPSFPVCGVGLGPTFGNLRVIGPLEHFLGTDATHGAPDPAPVTYHLVGRFALKVAPACARGAEIRIEPPAAAEITARALTADGLLAGVGIRAHARSFRIIGTGPKDFEQRVELACPWTGPCLADPSEEDHIVVPTIEAEYPPAKPYLLPYVAERTDGRRDLLRPQ